MKTVIPDVYPRIFVAMTAYREADCMHSLRDLFAKAAQPMRVQVGLCWVYDAQGDVSFIQPPVLFESQLRQRAYRQQDAQGINWARKQALELWQGEDYILQLSAQVRFEPGWDVALIRTLGRCPSAQPMLTASLPGFVPPARLMRSYRRLTRLCISALAPRDAAKFVQLGGRRMPIDGLKAPFLSGILSNDFIFARAEAFQAAPPDPFLPSGEDALTRSARWWTKGYDFYQPDSPILYRNWRQSVPAWGMTPSAAQEELARTRHLLAVREHAGLPELDTYSMGNMRSLAEYGEFVGIDFKQRTLSRKAELGLWGLPFYDARSDIPTASAWRAMDANYAAAAGLCSAK